ncbi:MAG: tetratricopeptide repeat protein [Roseivirga sp.]
MYTQHQKALSIILLTSLLLQSCGGNFILGEHRPAMREHRRETPNQEQAAGAKAALGAPKPRQVEEKQQEEGSVSERRLTSVPGSAPLCATLQAQPKRPQAALRKSPAVMSPAQRAWRQRQGLPCPADHRGRLLGGAGGNDGGAWEEKQSGPPPTSQATSEEARTDTASSSPPSSQPSPARTPPRALSSSSLEPGGQAPLAGLEPGLEQDEEKEEKAQKDFKQCKEGEEKQGQEERAQERAAAQAHRLLASLERLRGNDPQLTSLDLREDALTLDQLQALDTALATNTVLGYIYWGTLPQDEPVQMLQAHINEKLVRNTLHYQYHPTDLVHGLLAKHVYKMPHHPGDHVYFAQAWPEMPSAFCDLRQGWTIAQVNDDRNHSWADAMGINGGPASHGKTGFYSVLYANESSHQAVLCFQGTKIEGLRDLVSKRSDAEADINGILAAEVHKQQYLAYEATQQAIQFARERGYHLSITGHSLGGFLAELAVFFCYNDFGYRAVAGIVFDSPGSLDWLQGVQSNIESRATSFQVRDLPITTYLSAPNPINSGDGHLGLVYRLYPETMALPRTAQLASSLLPSATRRQVRATTSHMLSVMLPCFDPELGRPSESAYKRVGDWPKLKKEHISKLKRPERYRLPVTSGRVVGLLRNLHRASAALDVTLASLDEEYRERELSGEASFRQQYEGHYRESHLGVGEDVLDRESYEGTDTYLLRLWEQREELRASAGLSPVTRQVLSRLVASYSVEERGGQAVVRSDEGQPVATVRGQLRRAREVLPREEFEKALRAPRRSSAQQAVVPSVQLLSHIAQDKLKDYVAREEAQMRLEEQLATSGVCILSGHGGAGKSTLAAEYAHRQREQGKTVYWLSTETPSKLLEGVEQMARRVGIDYRSLAQEFKDSPATYFQELSALVYQRVQGQPTLLILDNAEAATQELLEASLANRPQAVQVVITTRDGKRFRGHGQVVLEAFSEQEAQAYLQRRFASMGRPLDRTTQTAILSAVGWIPQPLSLATGYLEEYETKSVGGYLEKLQSIRAGHSQAGESFVLPQVALGLEGLAPEAQQLLRYGAYLDADYMPVELLSALVGDSEELDDWLNKLGRLSLVTVVRKEGEEVGIQIHREVQKACRQYGGWQGEAALAEHTLLQRLVGVLSRKMPWVEAMRDERWREGALYAPHVAAVMGEHTHADRAVLGPHEDLARLLAHLGEYRDTVQCNFQEGLKYKKQALEMRRALFEGQNHPDIAMSLNNVGIAYEALGQGQEGLKYQKQALEMYRALFEGQNHPDIAMSLNNVGNAYQALGQGQEGLKYQKQALEMRRALFEGQNHPDIAMSLNNVGAAYQALGQVQEGLKYQKQALEMYRALFEGQNHPDLARSLNNVGIAYEALGQVQEGLKYQKQALEMRRALFEGQNHPDIAMSLNNVGIAYQALGQGQEGLKYKKQALEMYRALFEGQNHPDLASSLNNVGVAHEKLGDNTTALRYYREALTMYEQVLPANHPSIQIVRRNVHRLEARPARGSCSVA